jgi:hypothetical protein
MLFLLFSGFYFLYFFFFFFFLPWTPPLAFFSTDWLALNARFWQARHVQFSAAIVSWSMLGLRPHNCTQQHNVAAAAGRCTFKKIEPKYGCKRQYTTLVLRIRVRIEGGAGGKAVMLRVAREVSFCFE